MLKYESPEKNLKMAEDKKSFVLYADLIHTVKKMILKDRKENTNNSGELLYHLLQYINDENPEAINDVVDFTFEPIKQQLKRDLVKYKGKKKQWSDAGKASAEARRLKKEQNNESSTDSTDVGSRSTDSTVSDNVNVSDSVSDSVSVNDTVNVNDTKKEKVYSKEVHACFKNCLGYFPEHLHPKKESDWLDVIEKLYRIDKIPYQAIEKITQGARKNDFWAKNFLSLTKLRKKNKDDIPYIVVFNEQLKSNHNGREQVSSKDLADAWQRLRD